MLWVQSLLPCGTIASAPMRRRAAIYARISDDRAGGGLGVARQEQDCRALADRLNLTVVQVYTDNDISAFDRRKIRPAYRQLIDDVRSGAVDVVLTWHTDRLHRSPRELEDWIDACEVHGVRVHTVQAGLVDLSSASGRMTARVLGAGARYESEQKRDRNLRKARELADAGKIGNGGPRPFGYKADRITVDPEEAAVVRRIAADIINGRGLRTICRDLHAEGIRTTQGGPFSAQGLRYMMLRARYIGWREHHGRLAAPAVWDAILDRETWEAVRAVLKNPDRPNAGQRSHVRKYLLTGFLRCGLCGTPLKPSRNADVQRFACRPEPGDGKCGKILVRYDPAEALVVDAFLARTDTIQPAAPHDPTESLREQIGHQEQRLEQLADLYADEGDALEFRRAGQKIRGRIADLRQQISDAGTRSRLHTPGLVREEWDGYDLDQRRDVLAEVIERVDVGPARPGNRFQPDRISIRWR